MLKKSVSILLAVTFCVSAALAQDATETKPAATPIKPVTSVIPANCAGFIAADSVQKFTDSLFEFISATDFGDMIQGMAPSGLMPVLTSQLGLGEGFNPQGGLAMVVVNLEKYGFDPDDAELDNIKKMPFVFLLAGKDVHEIFANAVFDDETQSFEMRKFGKIFYKQLGDYVAMSGNKHALELVGGEGPTVDTVMTESQKKFMASSDMIFFINYKTVMPYLLKAAKDEAVKMDDKQRKEILASAKQNEQIDGMAIGLNFGNEGMTINIALEYKAGSELAAMAAEKASQGVAKLDKLPNGKYFLAMSFMGLQHPLLGDSNKIAEKIIGVFKDSDMDLSGEFYTKLNKAISTAQEQVNGMQIYVGRSSKDSLAISACIDCNDADTLLALVPEKAEMIREVITILAKEKAVKKMKVVADQASKKAGQDVNTDKIEEVEKLKDVQLNVVQKVAVVEGVTLDAMVLDISKCEMKEDAKKKLVAILGDEQIRILYGKVSDKQIIVTLGGGVEFATDVVKAAKNGGKLEQTPEIAAALKNLPKNSSTVALVNLKNIFDAINDIKALSKPQATTEPADDEDESDDAEIPGVDDFTFEANTPVVLSDSHEGNVEVIRIDVPMPIFNDFIRLIMVKMTQAAMEGKSPDLPFPIPGM